jgi:hypothetical protein
MNGLSILGWWVEDEEGNADFVPHIPDYWDLTEEEKTEMFHEMNDEDVDAMYDYFHNTDETES